jgi:hypothetical protein
MLLSELYVKTVYLNLFGKRGARSLWNILRGAQAIEVRESLFCNEVHNLCLAQHPKHSEQNWTRSHETQRSYRRPSQTVTREVHESVRLERCFGVHVVNDFTFSKSILWFNPLKPMVAICTIYFTSQGRWILYLCVSYDSQRKQELLP